MAFSFQKRALLKAYLKVFAGQIVVLVFSTGSAFSQSTFTVNSDWFRQVEDSKTTNWAWQTNPELLSAISYMAAGVAFDYDEYKADPTWGSKESVFNRCPRPETDETESFISRFSNIGYCTMKDARSGIDFLGRPPIEIRETKYFRDHFRDRANGTSAHIADSYAILPLALRRQGLATLTQIWAPMSCPVYKSNKNIQQKREIAAPAIFYDCAYRDPTLPALGNQIPFTPRDRGLPSHLGERLGGECTARGHSFYFLGENCQGQALVYLNMTEKDFDFVRLRDESDWSGAITTRTPAPAERAGLAAEIKKAFFTEIVDRTIYAAPTGEVFRRTVEFTGDGVGLNHSQANKADLENMRLYWRGDLNQIQSAYVVVGNEWRCRRRGDFTAPDHLPSGGSGYYAYLDRIPGPIEKHAGFIARQYRDVYIDVDEEFKADDFATREMKRRALVRNNYTLEVYDLDYDEDRSATGGPIHTASWLHKFPVSRVGPQYPVNYNVDIRGQARYFSNRLPGMTTATPLDQAPLPVPDLIAVAGTNYHRVNSQAISINEYWTEDPYSDSLGIFPALTCSPGENMTFIGRNNRAWDSRKSEGDAVKDCLRFPLSKRMRLSTDPTNAFGPAGNPLSDLSFLSFGAVASAMFCNGDPATLSSVSNSYRNPGGAAATAFALPGSASDQNMLDYLSKIDDWRSRVIGADQFFEANSTAAMSIGSRSLWLGDETKQIADLPINYGQCVVKKMPNESPLHSMGPLSIPMQHYLIDLVIENVDKLDSGQAPNCP